MNARFALLAVIWATDVAAQDCRVIADDVERLACYDRAAGRDGDAAAADTNGKWTGSQHTDPLTDSTITTLSLIAETSTSCYGRKPAMIVRCGPRKLDVYIKHGCYAPGDEGRHQLWVRFDDAKPVATYFTSDTTDGSVGIWGTTAATTFLARLIPADRFVIEVVPYRDPPQSIVFDLRGLAKTLRDSGMGCGVEELVK